MMVISFNADIAVKAVICFFFSKNLAGIAKTNKISNYSSSLVTWDSQYISQDQGRGDF